MTQLCSEAWSRQLSQAVLGTAVVDQRERPVLFWYLYWCARWCDTTVLLETHTPARAAPYSILIVRQRAREGSAKRGHAGEDREVGRGRRSADCVRGREMTPKDTEAVDLELFQLQSLGLSRWKQNHVLVRHYLD